MKKYSSIYAIFMGICMIGMWVVFYITESIPEIKTKPVELGMHVLAEITTAILLIISGVLLLSKNKYGKKIYLFSTGMLFYTLIMSPGYFLEQKEIGFGLMFLGFLILLLILTIPIIKKDE